MQLQLGRVPTSGSLGVLLDVLALLDELVLGGGAGKAALRRGAELSRKARSAAGDLACSEHGEGCGCCDSFVVVEGRVTSVNSEARLDQTMDA